MIMKCFEIADIFVRLAVDKRLLHDAIWDFEVEEAELEVDRKKPIVTMRTIEEPYQKSCIEKQLVQGDTIDIYEAEDYYRVSYKKYIQVRSYINYKYINQTDIYLADNVEEEGETAEKDVINMMYSIRDAFFFHMLKFGRIAIHSASILYNNKVWLFAAKSGTGKSTHVKMWDKKLYPHEGYNGDLVVCYLEGDKIIAANVPWSGTSNIYSNQKAIAGGILFLKRDAENKVCTVSEDEACIQIVSSCLTPTWNRELFEQNMNTVEAIVKKINYGILFCRPDEEAARVSKEFIDAIMD